jgi:hypothetical protein
MRKYLRRAWCAAGCDRYHPTILTILAFAIRGGGVHRPTPVLARSVSLLTWRRCSSRRRSARAGLGQVGAVSCLMAFNQAGDGLVCSHKRGEGGAGLRPRPRSACASCRSPLCGRAVWPLVTVSPYFVFTGSGGRFGSFIGFAAIAFMTSSMPRSNCGSWPAITEAGSFSTSMSGGTPSPSTM